MSTVESRSAPASSLRGQLFTHSDDAEAAAVYTSARTVVVAPAAYSVGTMGELTVSLMARLSRTSSSAYQYVGGAAMSTGQPEQSVLVHPTPSYHLARIREILKPAVLELANAFGVSRQAVYGWQAGVQPGAEAAAKLAMLAQAAEVFADSGVVVTGQTLHRKVAGGGTVLSAVLTGGDAVQIATSLVQTLQREEAQRSQLAAQLAGRKRAPVQVADYGVPALPSDV